MAVLRRLLRPGSRSGTRRAAPAPPGRVRRPLERIRTSFPQGAWRPPHLTLYKLPQVIEGEALGGSSMRW
jgi:hypothetical protein